MTEPITNITIHLTLKDASVPVQIKRMAHAPLTHSAVEGVDQRG